MIKYFRKPTLIYTQRLLLRLNMAILCALICGVMVVRRRRRTIRLRLRGRLVVLTLRQYGLYRAIFILTTR